MAAILTSVGTALVGTLFVGWFRQKNDESEWDPSKYNISNSSLTSSLNSSLNHSLNHMSTTASRKAAVVLQQDKKGKSAPPSPGPGAKQPAAPPKEAIILNKETGTAKMSDAGMSVLSTLTTKFGSVTLTPETNVSFRRREMEAPDQSRLNEYALQDLGGEMEFVVASEEVYDCPFARMVSVAHQKKTKMIGSATPQMERVLRGQGDAAQQNIEKLKRLNGCTVNIRRLGKYVITDHLPQGDGVLSRDGRTLVLNKGLKAGNHPSVQLQSGDKITFVPNHQTNGGEFSIYKCQMGTSLPDRQNDDAHDSYETCLSERIAQFDVDAEKKNERNMYMDSMGRNRFKKAFMEKTFQQVDEVQFPPSMERPDVYCDDVARMARDGFPQKPGTRSLMGGDVGQKNPIEGTRLNISLAADSHYGTQTKMASGKGGKGVRNVIGPKHDPARDQERMERMKQPMSKISANRPRGYTDMSGLRPHTDKWDRTFEPRAQDHRFRRDRPELTTAQMLNHEKRGGYQKDPFYDFQHPRKATLGEDRTHRQAGGYMDGGMLIHEINEHGGRNVSENKYRQENSLDVQQQMYDEQHSAGKDDKTTERDMRLYGVSKPVVRLTQLTRIPGVMAKRGVGDLNMDLMDPSRPHEVIAKVDYLKDAASKQGVRRDYGHFTNQFKVADDPHGKNYYDNAVDPRGKSDAIEFGRQTGGSQANYTFTGENRTQEQDHKYRREKPLDVQQQMYEDQHSAGQAGKTVERNMRHDIYKYGNIHDQDQGAVARRENTHEERMSNARATSYLFRGVDGAENPVVHPREDADLSTLSKKDGSSLTAKTSTLYSEHDERSVVESNKDFRQGLVAARENSYLAGISTATGHVVGADQKMNLRENTNATRDHNRREWTEERPGVVLSMENGMYSVRLEDGKVETKISVMALKKRSIKTDVNVGDVITNNNNTPSGKIIAREKDGSVSIELKNGAVQDGVFLETVQTQTEYDVGEQVIATVRRTAIGNRPILKTTPERYDNVIRSTKVAYNGEQHSMALPINEKGTEWYRDDTMKAGVDEMVLGQRLSKPLHHGQNEAIQQNATNALISTGFASAEEATGKLTEDRKNNEVVETEDFAQRKQESLLYPTPSGNLVHRPEFHIHSED